MNYLFNCKGQTQGSLSCTWPSMEEREKNKKPALWFDVDYICEHLPRMLFFLKKLKNLVTEYLVIMSGNPTHQVWNTSLWGHAAASEQFILLQKRAIRLICRWSTNQEDHCRPLSHPVWSWRESTTSSSWVVCLIWKTNLSSFLSMGWNSPSGASQ